jgi:hypothetical protein
MQREVLNPSLFDTMHFISNTWNNAKDIICYSCKNARILVAEPKDRPLTVPLERWGRIFQWLGKPPGGSQWRVFWFPAAAKRVFPPHGHPVNKEHINGGYSMPCRHDTIVVYREEEATRVLIHEILHASCCDPVAPLPIKEANTETWAELFLVALCSGGSQAEAARLWKIQSQWIADQNYLLTQHHKVLSLNEYAWRYTVGRAQILYSLNIELPKARPPAKGIMDSGRFTSPELCN